MLLKYGVQQAPPTLIVYWRYKKRIIRLLSNSDTRHSDYSFPPSNPLFFKEQLLNPLRAKVGKIWSEN